MDEETLMLWSVVLIGTAAVGTGVVGILLPPGSRLEVLLGPVAGIGVGIVVLAVGQLLEGGASPGSDDLYVARVFLVGSILGWIAVALTLFALVQRDRRADQMRELDQTSVR
jgi:hypothetical protein